MGTSVKDGAGVPQLNGTNYENWRFRVQLFLEVAETPMKHVLEEEGCWLHSLSGNRSGSHVRENHVKSAGGTRTRIQRSL